MSIQLLTGGRRAAARLAVAGLSAIALAAPSALAHATTVASSVTQTPPSSTVTQGTAVSYSVDARDSGGVAVAGQTFNVIVSSAASSPSQPVSVTGVAGATSSGASGAWAVSGTLVTGAAGTATYTVASSVPGPLTVRVYGGSAPFNGSQISAVSTQSVTALGADAVTTFSLSPGTDTRVVGAGHVINVTGVAAAGGALVAGVTPVGIVSGPNSLATVTCTATTAAGTSTCSYLNALVGSDSVTIYINKSTGVGPQLETGELRAVVTRITTVVLPVITVPTDITVAATSSAGAVVTFAVSSTIGTATCDHVSGSTFPIGTTTVVCSAGTGPSLVTKSFHVTVSPLPGTSTVTIVVPKRIKVVVREPQRTAVVTFTTSASDSVDGALVVTCDHPSGSVFVKGETRVTCTATNSRGVVATGIFHVVVKVERKHHERNGDEGKKHERKHGDHKKHERKHNERKHNEAAKVEAHRR